MADFDLRPMSLGEILDRTFSLYRSNFVLFAGISAIPHLFVLAWSLTYVVLVSAPAARLPVGFRPHTGFAVMAPALNLFAFVVEFFVVYLVAQCATTYAVSELYLNRSTSIGAALRQMGRGTWRLAGVTLLNGAAILFGILLFLVPGIWLSCRLITALPAALLENLGPWQSFRRGFLLTRGHVRRALGIYLLYFAFRVVVLSLIIYPSRLAAGFSRSNLAMAQLSLGLIAVVNVSLLTLVEPLLAIAATVFYFDLRVRKEALDLQIMMNSGDRIPAGPVDFHVDIVPKKCV